MASIVYCIKLGDIDFRWNPILICATFYRIYDYDVMIFGHYLNIHFLYMYLHRYII